MKSIPAIHLHPRKEVHTLIRYSAWWRILSSFRAPSVDYSKLPHVVLADLHPILANGLAKTPPMGWNSWNEFRTQIDDATVRAIADAIASNGMKEAGYQYVIIDDGWQGARKKRDSRAEPALPGYESTG